MTYQETLEYMFAQLPMYHRIGAAAYKADIQPTVDMMAALGNPERKFKSIHVAGTNGKGSVSHFLASILQEAGYKVGLYTSPHLVDFRERIRINGEMLPQQAVVDFVATHSPLLTGEGAGVRPLSFFEMTVGMAFDYFAREQVDIAVVEVGMGGRLDSTNVMPPVPPLDKGRCPQDGGVLLSIITNIGLDHTQFLGDTLEKIAFEKAGIIKEGVPVVIGETQPETKPVFERIAAERHAPVTFADQHYRINEKSGQWPVASGQWSEYSDRLAFTVDILRGNPSFFTPHSSFTSQLTGEYQKKNIATVLEAVEVLRNIPPFTSHLSPLTLQRGLARVVTNTHLQGRWQIIGRNPLTVCETAHNEPGIRAMLPKLAEISAPHIHLVYGCVNDKDYRHILQLLISQISIFNFQFSIYFTQPSVPRGLPVADLQQAAEEMGIRGDAYSNVKEAIAAARKHAAAADLVLVTGSIFLVADALA